MSDFNPTAAFKPYLDAIGGPSYESEIATLRTERDALQQRLDRLSAQIRALRRHRIISAWCDCPDDPKGKSGVLSEAVLLDEVLALLAETQEPTP